MFKIWVRIKGSVSGTMGYFYSDNKGVWSTDCRKEAKYKMLSLYGKARKFQTIAKYDFKIIEAM